MKEGDKREHKAIQGNILTLIYSNGMLITAGEDNYASWSANAIED